MPNTASGKLISFKESYKLCGQCHDPHSPKFKKMKPEPAPKKPGKIRNAFILRIPQGLNPDIFFYKIMTIFI